METSIISETVSQQTICGDPESLSLEINKNTKPQLASKEKMKIKQKEQSHVSTRCLL